MRFHLTAFPHTQTTKDYFTCAYTNKAIKLSKMLAQRGHEVFLYSGEQNEAVCTEHIPVLSEKERFDWFGVNDQEFMPEVGWDASEPYWRVYSGRTIAEIAKRIKPKDFILLGTSWPLKPIADAFPEAISCEHGVGYEGVICDDKIHAAYESYAWMHYVYGMRKVVNGRNFDCVIPNYFDPEDFPIVNNGKGNYLLFVGRVTPRKGVDICIEVAKATGIPLIIAGPTKGTRTQDEIPKISHPLISYAGAVNIQKRAELMAGAKALLCPTLYLEPFGGVCVEALMCGTPVIASDWGAFTETVVPGMNGYRCRVLKEYAAATAMVEQLKPEVIRKDAMDHYSLDAVAPLYEAWFGRLNSLWSNGWYAL